MKLYPLENKDQILKEVRKLDWKRDIPGGWLKYGPPREVCAYGDGSLYTDDGKRYGPKYKETAWAGAIPLNRSTLVVKTKPLPKDLISTGIMKQLRDCLRDNNLRVDDSSCTGMWCNYYNRPTDSISPHTDNENYYQKPTYFVSLTLYEDESDSLENLARFQIREDDKWKTINLPHASLLVMSGAIEHRVIHNKKNSPFRKRYNITFRTPVRMDEDLIKNYRFFSNFGRYYCTPYKLYFPFEQKSKHQELIDRFGKLVIKDNLAINRQDILEAIKEGKFPVKSLPPSTTTNMALYILFKNFN